MGWCYAFGPQIREGCDHAMVAGPDSCSCSACGAVCHGQFPGCATVWAAGPRRVAITKPGKDAGSLLPTLASPVRAEAPPALGPGGAPGPSFMDHAELHALRVDMQLLMWKFDQFRQATTAGDQLVQAAKKIEALAYALPHEVRAAVSAGVAEGVSAALEAHDEAAREMPEDDTVDGPRRRAPGRSGEAVSVADLDARFTWLVDAVSERFVVLGNEIARLQRQLAGESRSTGIANGAPAPAHPAPGSANGGPATDAPFPTPTPPAGVTNNGANSNGRVVVGGRVRASARDDTRS